MLALRSDAEPFAKVRPLVELLPASEMIDMVELVNEAELALAVTVLLPLAAAGTTTVEAAVALRAALTLAAAVTVADAELVAMIAGRRPGVAVEETEEVLEVEGFALRGQQRLELFRTQSTEREDDESGNLHGGNGCASIVQKQIAIEASVWTQYRGKHDA